MCYMYINIYIYTHIQYFYPRLWYIGGATVIWSFFFQLSLIGGTFWGTAEVPEKIARSSSTRQAPGCNEKEKDEVFQQPISYLGKTCFFLGEVYITKYL